MVVHICCSVDSHYFLQKLKQDFPNEKLLGLFYNPNIHPYSEYRLRLLDVQRSCDMLGIALIECEYDINHWFCITQGYEQAPEKGDRCDICFDDRFEISAKKCVEFGHTTFTSTLLSSPKKSLSQVHAVGVNIGKKYNIEFVCVDYRKNGGTQAQFELAKKDKLYQQDFCGCMYALIKQREIQKKFSDELFCAVNKQVLPASIEYRLNLYKKRLDYEQNSINYTIITECFLNFRLLRGYVEYNNNTIDSYILSYSYIKRKKSQSKVSFAKDGVYYFAKDSVKVIDINTLNNMLNKNYACVRDLVCNPLLYEDELALRSMINISFFSLNPIIVIDNIADGKYNFYIDSIIYDDVKEILLKL